ncbi:hypothetical protein ABH313_19095 [Chromobacterium vaccinii]|uniref:hypothetical protein n=1 Tax=Chromobacterium vaccinii TaxID=1108595 RepID=UPI0032604865
MKIIENYTAPTTDDLANLRKALGFQGEDMAHLTGVSGSNQWRKYTGGAEPRKMSLHMLFYTAARLSLPEHEILQVLDKMREIGATFDYNDTSKKTEEQ